MIKTDSSDDAPKRRRFLTVEQVLRSVIVRDLAYDVRRPSPLPSGDGIAGEGRTSKGNGGSVHGTWRWRAKSGDSHLLFPIF